jgi:hypothetical protein
MDKATLVGPDIEMGYEFLQALDRANVKVNVLIWAYLSEYEDWRLVVAARQFDALGSRDAYRLLFDSLAAAGFTVRDAPTITVLPMAHSFIKELRRIYGKATNGKRVFRSGISVRIFKQLIGDHWVEEAYAYRIS